MRYEFHADAGIVGSRNCSLEALDNYYMLKRSVVGMISSSTQECRGQLYQKVVWGKSQMMSHDRQKWEDMTFSRW